MVILKFVFKVIFIIMQKSALGSPESTAVNQLQVCVMCDSYY